jgi:hypothetical protein
MTKTQLIDHLLRLYACPEAMDLVRDTDLPPYRLWKTCSRGDWLLWLAVEAGVDRRQAILAACDCAETALKYVPDREDRPRTAIETARAWCEGRATVEKVEKAAEKAYDALDDTFNDVGVSAASGAVHAAAAVADAVADAVYTYTAVDAVDSVANAAYAYADAHAADASAYTAAVAAKRQALARCAELVRSRIEWSDVAEALEG